MGYNLFLDDIRIPEQVGNYITPKPIKELYYWKNWFIVRNYEQFVAEIEKRGLPDLVSFDHDLAQVHYDPNARKESFTYYPETGLDCMQWMINYIQEKKLKPPRVLVHSMNPVGKENIEKLFNNFVKHYKWDTSNESSIQMDK